MARAFHLERDGQAVGDLGEGPGPFVSASDASVYPVLAHARFTSADDEFEDDVAEVLDAESTFDAVLTALTARGFTLREAAYEDVFAPGPGPLGGAEHWS